MYTVFSHVQCFPMSQLDVLASISFPDFRERDVPGFCAFPIPKEYFDEKMQSNSVLLFFGVLLNVGEEKQKSYC